MIELAAFLHYVIVALIVGINSVAVGIEIEFVDSGIVGLVTVFVEPGPVVLPVLVHPDQCSILALELLVLGCTGRARSRAVQSEPPMPWAHQPRALRTDNSETLFPSLPPVAAPRICTGNHYVSRLPA